MVVKTVLWARASATKQKSGLCFQIFFLMLQCGKLKICSMRAELKTFAVFIIARQREHFVSKTEDLM